MARYAQRLGANAPSVEVPWSKGFDINALWDAALAARAKKVPAHIPVMQTLLGADGDIDFNRADIVNEAMRLAYCAGAQDGASESARGVLYMFKIIDEGDPEMGPGMAGAVDEQWRIMFAEAPNMGAHCLRMQRNLAADAAKAARIAKKTARKAAV